MASRSRRYGAADRHAACPGAFMSTRQHRPASRALRRGRTVAVALSVALHAVVFAALAVRLVAEAIDRNRAGSGRCLRHRVLPLLHQARGALA